MTTPIEEKICRQNKAIAYMREQLDRINALFEEQKKALGLSDEDLKAAAQEKAEPRLEAMMADAVREAKKAGRQAAASQQEQSATSAPKAGMRRRGLAI